MAGSGSRLRAAVPKAFVLLGGRPLWTHAAATFASIDACRAVVLVVPGDRVDEARRAAPRAVVVAGGARRQDSVRLGLAAVPADVALVAIHDAARPFVRRETIVAAVAEAARTGASLVAAPAKDTVKRVADGRVVETLDRASLWLAQTPQCFRLDVIRAAHAAAERGGWDVTDDCALVERTGGAVSVVAGDAGNLKITTPEDLELAERILAAKKI